MLLKWSLKTIFLRSWNCTALSGNSSWDTSETQADKKRNGGLQNMCCDYLFTKDSINYSSERKEAAGNEQKTDRIICLPFRALSWVKVPMIFLRVPAMCLLPFPSLSHLFFYTFLAKSFFFFFLKLFLFKLTLLRIEHHQITFQPRKPNNQSISKLRTESTS